MSETIMGWLFAHWLFGPPGRSERSRREVVAPPDTDAAQSPLASEDMALVRGIRAGDEDAFAHLWSEHQGRLTRFADRYLHSRDAAQDIVQDTFVRLWLDRTTFNPHASIAASLYRRVWHGVQHALRHARVTREYAARVQAGQLADPPVATLAGHIAVAEVEVGAEVDRLLDRMTPRVREIFLLSRRDGLSSAEIAETLGIGRQVVYNQLARAAKVIAEGLEELHSSP